MGAYSDDAILADSVRNDVLRRIVAPTLAGMAAEGVTYRGFLYCGLMLTDVGPKVLEYNVRLGDPEAQPIMMRLRSDLAELLLALPQNQLGGNRRPLEPEPCCLRCSRLKGISRPTGNGTGSLRMGECRSCRGRKGVSRQHADGESPVGDQRRQGSGSYRYR